MSDYLVIWTDGLKVSYTKALMGVSGSFLRGIGAAVRTSVGNCMFETYNLLSFV